MQKPDHEPDDCEYPGCEGWGTFVTDEGDLGWDEDNCPCACHWDELYGAGGLMQRGHDEQAVP